MYRLLIIFSGIFMLSCSDRTSYEKNYSYDPLKESLKQQGSSNLDFLKCSSSDDSCIFMKFKLKDGLPLECDNLGIRGSAVVKYDSIIPVPIYFQPSEKYKQSTYTAEIKQYEKMTSLYWYEKPLPDILDSTTYFFNDNMRLVKIFNNLDLFNLFTRVKIWGGFTNMCFIDSFAFNDKGLISERFTSYLVRNGRTDLYNSIPISTRISYTYIKDNKLTKIRLKHQFIDKTENYESVMEFENGSPKLFTDKGQVYSVVSCTVK